MDDDWEDSPAVTGSGFTNDYTDNGRNFSKGRGFTKVNNSRPNDNDNGDMYALWGDGGGADTPSYGESNGNDGGYRSDRGSRGGRGGGRSRYEDGNSERRGRGGGFRGGRDRNGSNDDGGDDFGSRGGHGGRNRGGFDDDGDEFGGRRGRGGGRGRGRGGSNNEPMDGEPEVKREIYIPPEPTEDVNEIFSSGITSGINFDKFDNIPVEVTGENIVPSINSFSESGLRPLLLENVLKSGYDRPTPIQKAAIPIIMAGRDVMACAQTGSGKTAAFLLPILHNLLSEGCETIVEGECALPQVVIVSPTRELAIQIGAEARKFSHDSMIRTCVTYGGTAVRHQTSQITRGCNVLVATPGRMFDFVRKENIAFSKVRFVVLDEADRMLDMGFMGDIEQMMSHPTMVDTASRQTLMFSATFPEEIQRLASRFLNNYLFITVGIVGGACTDVQQEFYEVGKFEKRNKLSSIIEEQGSEKTLVFVETKRNADFIASYLSEAGYKTTSIHGDRLQREREEALGTFKSGIHNILVATDVAARGLDIKNVKHVINFDLPKSIDEYVHRIGRTGRLGNRGKATSFFDSRQDGQLSTDLVRILKQANQPIPDWLEDSTSGVRGNYSSRSFGGRDVRKDDFGQATNFNNAAEEEEEVW